MSIENGINKTNNVLKLILQSAAIISIIIPLLYFPVNTRLRAMEEKTSSVMEQHNKDCDMLKEDNKELRHKIEVSVTEKELMLQLNPLVNNVTELKEDLKSFIRQDILFKQEIMKKLN